MPAPTDTSSDATVAGPSPPQIVLMALSSQQVNAIIQGALAATNDIQASLPSKPYTDRPTRPSVDLD